MNAISKLALATLVFASAASAASAQDAHAGHGAHGAPAPAAHAAHHAAVAGDLATGEIKKVDKAAGKITIRHSELKNLSMAAMTMVFRVKDPAMLTQVKAGDHVKFAAEKVNGALTVTKLEQAK